MVQLYSLEIDFVRCMKYEKTIKPHVYMVTNYESPVIIFQQLLSSVARWSLSAHSFVQTMEISGIRITYKAFIYHGIDIPFVYAILQK